MTASINAPEGNVACPGHPHELTANVTPDGGTCVWSIVTGGSILTKENGDALDAGSVTKVRLLGVKPGTVKVRLRYSKDGRRRTANISITIHKIKFTVTNFDIEKGVSAANEFQEGLIMGPRSRLHDNALTPEGPTFKMSAEVQISVADSCRRRDDCAKNHRVGWLQTMRENERKALYSKKLITVTVALPIRDAQPNDDGNYSHPPFYHGPSVKAFDNNEDTQTAAFEDSPWWPNPGVGPAPWTNEAYGELFQITFKNRFTAWLVVQNIAWADLADEYGSEDFNEERMRESFTFLKHVNWSCGFSTSVDNSKSVGSRAATKSKEPWHRRWWTGRGRKPLKLDQDIFNKKQQTQVDPVGEGEEEEEEENPDMEP
ncbi:MAG: hypothetical protein ABII79_12100 [bacterium]